LRWTFSIVFIRVTLDTEHIRAARFGRAAEPSGASIVNGDPQRHARASAYDAREEAGLRPSCGERMPISLKDSSRWSH
jgi:hypothetical protein